MRKGLGGIDCEQCLTARAAPQGEAISQVRVDDRSGIDFDHSRAGGRHVARDLVNQLDVARAHVRGRNVQGAHVRVLDALEGEVGQVARVDVLQGVRRGSRHRDVAASAKARYPVGKAKRRVVGANDERGTNERARLVKYLERGSLTSGLEGSVRTTINRPFKINAVGAF